MGGHFLGLATAVVQLGQYEYWDVPFYAMPRPFEFQDLNQIKCFWELRVESAISCWCNHRFARRWKGLSSEVTQTSFSLSMSLPRPQSTIAAEPLSCMPLVSWSAQAWSVCA